MQESPKVSSIDRIAAMILIVILGIAPIIFVPFIAIGPEISKIYFLGGGILLVAVFWVIARMIEGTIVFPRSPLVCFAILIPIIFLLSALFSSAPHVSFGGLFLDSGTVAGMLVFSLIFLGSALYLNTERSLTLLAKIALWATAIISVFQLAYIFLGPRFLNLGNFWSATSNMVGGWNDLGLWYAFVLIGLMIGSQFIRPSRLVRVLLFILGVVSLFFLVLVNFTLIWGLVALFALLIFVYSLTGLRQSGEEPRYHFPVAPFIVLLVALFFFLANPIAGGFLSQKFGISQTEIRPSVSSTLSVVGDSLVHHPLVGVGPDRFSSAWLLYHPKNLVLTQYWNTQFNSGFGFIPSLFATTGILGGLTVLAFLILFLIAGFLHAFRPGNDRKAHFYLFISFMLGLFGWIVAFVYNPGPLAIAGAFALSGIFIGLLKVNGQIPSAQVSFLKDPRHSFFSIIFLIVFLIGSLFILFTGGEKFFSVALYARAETLSGTSAIPQAEGLLNSAIALYPSDTYYQSRAALELASLQQVLNNQSLSQDIVKSEFQSLFSEAESDDQSAVAYDRTNPDNWTNLASLYQNVLPLGVSGAYDNAKTALTTAGLLMPGNPSIDLLLSQLDLANKDSATATTDVQAALALKPNYTDAIFLLAQIEAAGGDTATAISQLEAAALANPQDASVYLELGLFKYDSGDYAGAVSALERSVTLDPTVLNAQYFLALSYAKDGRTSDAIALFTELQKAFPNDQTLPKIIANLNAGLDPLNGLQQPATTPLPDASSTSSASTAGTTTPPTSSTGKTSSPGTSTASGKKK